MTSPKEPVDSIELDASWPDDARAPTHEAAPSWPARRPLPDFRRHERAFLKRLLILLGLSGLYFLLGWQRLQPESVGEWLAPTYAEMHESGREDCGRYADDLVASIASAAPELRPLAGGGKAELCAWRHDIADMLGSAAGASSTAIANLDVGAADFPWSDVKVRLTRVIQARLPDGRLRSLVSDESLTVRNRLFGLEIARAELRVRFDDGAPASMP
ncbi:hypothetical protein [Derxia lacustris]|uniref:hypothetical protein n=1 Tax=Derxia lacustris TaxID=764842 RepID=UPI000A1745D3|nr:hypothetical protein [Derxia lacustris]